MLKMFMKKDASPYQKAEAKGRDKKAILRYPDNMTFLELYDSYQGLILYHNYL